MTVEDFGEVYPTPSELHMLGMLRRFSHVGEAERKRLDPLLKRLREAVIEYDDYYHIRRLSSAPSLIELERRYCELDGPSKARVLAGEVMLPRWGTEPDWETTSALESFPRKVEVEVNDDDDEELISWDEKYALLVSRTGTKIVRRVRS